jgi:hypothetical protein
VGGAIVTPAAVGEGSGGHPETVYAYLDSGQPTQEWIEETASDWELSSLWARLGPADAVRLVQKSDRVKHELGSQSYRSSPGHVVLAEFVELVEDTKYALWRFALYVEDDSGQRRVLVAEGSEGWRGSDAYMTGVTATFDIPLYLQDWTADVVRSEGWSDVSNISY